jgi:hypothetical protein
MKLRKQCTIRKFLRSLFTPSSSCRTSSICVTPQTELMKLVSYRFQCTTICLQSDVTKPLFYPKKEGERVETCERCKKETHEATQKSVDGEAPVQGDVTLRLVLPVLTVCCDVQEIWFRWFVQGSSHTQLLKLTHNAAVLSVCPSACFAYELLNHSRNNVVTTLQARVSLLSSTFTAGITGSCVA